MLKRLSSLTFAALTLCAMCGGQASAQSALGCSATPQVICEDQELLALEGERAASSAQLAALDPQSATLAMEQTWIDGLVSGEDVACYRTAYLNHNQTLQQSIAALPAGADATAPLEEPVDAPSVEEETSALDAAQEERLRDASQAEPTRGAQAYVATGMPGWGFFTMIGVTLFVFWRLMSALARNRRELRAEETRLQARR